MDVGKYFPYEQKELTTLDTEFRLKVNLFYRFVPSRPSCHSEAYLLPHTPASPREWWLANAVGAGLKRRGREGKKEGRSASATSSITVRYNWGQRERKDDAAKEGRKDRERKREGQKLLSFLARTICFTAAWRGSSL